MQGSCFLKQKAHSKEWALFLSLAARLPANELWRVHGFAPYPFELRQKAWRIRQSLWRKFAPAKPHGGSATICGGFFSNSILIKR